MSVQPLAISPENDCQVLRSSQLNFMIQESPFSVSVRNLWKIPPKSKEVLLTDKSLVKTLSEENVDLEVEAKEHQSTIKKK